MGWERHDAGTQYLWPGAAWGVRQQRRHGAGRVGSGAAESDADTRGRKKKATDRRDPADSGTGRGRDEWCGCGCWATLRNEGSCGEAGHAETRSSWASK